jgi:predicted lysophospholipase L1 biosynthesis ABC-type transport system permease subunit
MLDGGVLVPHRPGAGTRSALAATRALKGFLFAVSPADAWSLDAAIGLLAIVSLLANYLPAQRASKTDPMAALRMIRVLNRGKRVPP